MAAPNKKLAESLDVLTALQGGGRRVFRSDELTRVHRERLIKKCARGRQYAVVRIVLGILRTLLRRAFRRGVAPFPGAVALAAG